MTDITREKVLMHVGKVVFGGQRTVFVASHPERKSALYSVYPLGAWGARVAYRARGAEALFLTS